MNAGIAYATLAFVMWGLFPLYFRHIAAVPPLEVVLHRSAWSLLFVMGLLAALRRFGWLRELAAQPRRLGSFALSALLLAVNWLLYVYAVQNGQVVEASLGYFINPIVSVLLGVLVLHERLNKAQWCAVALAAVGVLWLTLLAGRLPWIALMLAVSFGLYGLMRKTTRWARWKGWRWKHCCSRLWCCRPWPGGASAGPRCHGPGRPGTRRLADHRWTADRAAAAAVCRQRPPPAAGHCGPAAVLVTHHPTRSGRVGVPRALRPHAPGRLRLYLGRPGAVFGGRLAAFAPIADSLCLRRRACGSGSRRPPEPPWRRRRRR